MRSNVKQLFANGFIQMTAVAIGAAAFVLVFRPGHPTSAAAPRLTFDSLTNAKAVEEFGHRSGKLGASKKLVLFSDFECPFCKKFESVLAEMEREGQPLEVAFRHYPLQDHPKAYLAAIAAECAGEQGRFQEIRALLFAEIDSLAGNEWRDLARRSGVADLEKFSRCLVGERPKEHIRRDMTAARDAGIPGTPFVIMNGKKLSRPPTSQELRELVTR